MGTQTRTRSERRDVKLYARLGLTPGASSQEVETAHRELLAFLEQAPESLRGWAEAEIAALGEARARLAQAPRAATGGGSPLRRIAVGVATLLVTALIVVAVYNMGGGQDEPATSQAGASGKQELSPGDRARVAQLMRKLSADPEDEATLVALGDVYFKAGYFNDAGRWMERAVLIDPENVRARLALGAALFNLGDAPDARRHWLRVIAIDPENVEAYYDLGFLYLSEDPPDITRAKTMWRKVVEIAPGSRVAKTVSTHLKGLEEAGPEATAPQGEG